MNEKIPAGWTTQALGDCCDVIAGVGFPAHLQGVTDADIPFYKVGDISKAWQAGRIHLDRSPNTVTQATARSLASRLVPAATVVFAKIGAAIALNRRAVTTKPCLVDNNVMGLSPTSTLLDAMYLFYFTCTLNLDEHARATTVPSIRKGDVESLTLPLPGLPEQHRIVEAIESYFTRLDDAVATLERVQRNLNRYRASVLKAAVEGRLVPTEAELARAEGRDYEPASVLLERILAERRRRWEEAGRRGKYQEPVAADTSGLPVLPEGWCWASLEALTSPVRTISYGILMPKEHVPDGVPYVKVRDMRSGTLDVGKLQRTSPAIAAQYARASLRAGDLLLAIRGTYGRVVEVPPELEGGNITQDTARLDLLPGCHARYVRAVLLSPHIQRYFKKVARGVAVKGVNIADVRATPVPLPPQPEQVRIAMQAEDILSVIDTAVRLVDLNERRCTRLRQSILKWAFEGKLADQNPNDEPASALLARIQAEREAAGATKKASRAGRKSQRIA